MAKTKSQLNIDYKDYPTKVINGEIVACNYIKLACQRFLDWFKRDDIEFREDKVNHIINFISKLKHFEGSFAGQNFELLPYQIWIVSQLGWYYKGTDKRVIHNMWIELARKSGKTYLAAAIALYIMIADGEQGAEVEFVANSRKQAGIAFDKADKICKGLDPKGKLLKRYRDKIKFPFTNSFLQVLSSDANTQDGWSSSLTVFDEVHSYKDDSMVQVMRSSQGFRKNPLIIYITTAGFNLYGFAYPFRNNCIDILNGITQDDSTFVAIYTLDAEDDFRKEECWIKANPSLDVTISREYLREQVTACNNNVSFEVATRTKNFNEWLSESEIDEWVDQSTLNEISQDIDLDYFKDKEVYGYMGVDLSAVSDLTALSLMIPYNDKFYFKNWYFLPSMCLKKNSNAELYRNFKRKNELIVMEGNVVDYDYVTKKIQEIADIIPIQLISYDKWNSTEWALRMTELGMPIAPYSQAISNFSIPSKALERNIKSGNVILDCNSMNKWCFKNVVLKFDWNDNIKPVKATNQDKIDGVIAMIQAMGGYLSQTHYNGEIFSV